MARVVLFLICLYVKMDLHAQNAIGLPEIFNYSKQGYKGGTQNWDIAQDENGFIYIANNEGMLSFDGIYWKAHPLPNRTITRSVAIGESERIYVGGQDELGYFSPGDKGLQYNSLKQLISPEHRSFSDVWDIVTVNQEVFFRTNQRIFRLMQNRMTVYPANNWVFMGAARGYLFAQDGTKGVLRLENDAWTPLFPKDGLPADCLITAVIDGGKDSIYFTSLKHGMYLFSDNKFTALRSAELDKIAGYNIYNATAIGDYFALATNQKGCFVMDRSGNLIQQFSRLDGLQNNNILSIFTDKAKNLWLGLDNGIDFIAYNSAIKKIFPDKENDGSGYSAIVYDNALYIATTNGLYYAPLQPSQDLSFVKSKFTMVPGISGQVWNLSNVNGRLFVGHHEGFFEIRDKVAYPVDRTTGFWNFLPLGAVLPSAKMVAGTYEGIRLYTFEKSTLTELERVNFESSRFVAVADDVTWVSHPYKGVYKVSVEENNFLRVENVETGLELTNFGNYVFKIRNRIVITTEKGIYEYDPLSKTFIPYGLLQDLLPHVAIRYLKEDKMGNIWFVFEKNLGVVDFSASIPRVVYIPELNQKMVSGLEQVYVVDEENIFVGGEKGFYHINYVKYRNQSPDIAVFLRQVNVEGDTDSLLFGGHLMNNQVQQENVSLSYNWNRFRFEFSAPKYEQQNNVTYSFFLKGFDNGWSEWTDKSNKEYEKLPPGVYQFQVKAQNTAGYESAVVSYSFLIRPPWYRSIPAFVFYACLFAFGIYKLYQSQKRKFRLQQKRYEEKQKQLRDMHQLELEKSEKQIVKLENEKLEAEIQHKNKEMASATMHLVKKGELISRIKEELQKLYKGAEEGRSDALKKMIKILDEEDKMDADWEHFTIHFDKAHNDFFVALKKKHVNLTPNELKLCAYLRMNLSTKEMAQLMNISVRGVEISRYRLRKKLQLPTEVSLFTYLLGFHAKLSD